MIDAVIFVVAFLTFFAVRAVAVMVFFYFILPEGDRCPNCDAATLHVQSRGWTFFLPRLRPSWCFECNWHGLLRIGPLTSIAQPRNEITHSR